MPWNDSHPAQYPPWLNDGASFTDDNDNLYLYGGFSSGLGGPKVPPVYTWRYDIAANNWTHEGFSGPPMVRLCQGGAVQGHANNKAYYLGGSFSPGGNPHSGSRFYMDTGLLELDMDTRTWSNYSTTEMNRWGTIGEGYVGLIETVGEKGLIVAFGGYTHPVGEGFSYLAAGQTNVSNHVCHLPHDYKIALLANARRTRWKTCAFTTSRNRNGTRRRRRAISQAGACQAVQWLQRHLIGRPTQCQLPSPSTTSTSCLTFLHRYIFGGMSTTTKASDGNVYILSIPSFRWIRATEDTNIRIKHQCLLAQNHTMLVIGGITPETKSELVPEISNCHGATFANGIGIFDTRSLSWQTNYNASDEGGYLVPLKVLQVIGGRYAILLSLAKTKDKSDQLIHIYSESGGAILTQPKHGFNSTELRDTFRLSRTSTNPSPSETSITRADPYHDSNKPSISKGGIAGAVVGCVIGAATIAGLVFFIIRRKHKRSALQKQSTWADPPTANHRNLETCPRELPGSEKHGVIFELEGDMVEVELPSEVKLSEMPAGKDEGPSRRSFI